MAEKNVSAILDILSKEYGRGAYPGRSSEGLNPEWEPDPFHVLITTILSQRTKDNNTRKASDNLFKRFDSVTELASANAEEVAVLIRPAGFPIQKAKAIIECCNILVNEYDCIVPDDTETLLTLPMVGRKTAACVRSYAMGIPAVCVDTHVHRISNIMGIVHTSNPTETEMQLMNITPRERWIDINKFFVRHGQIVCLPNRPRCDNCSVRVFCDHFSAVSAETARGK